MFSCNVKQQFRYAFRLHVSIYQQELGEDQIK